MVFVAIAALLFHGAMILVRILYATSVIEKNFSGYAFTVSGLYQVVHCKTKTFEVEKFCGLLTSQLYLGCMENVRSLLVRNVSISRIIKMYSSLPQQFYHLWQQFYHCKKRHLKHSKSCDTLSYSVASYILLNLFFLHLYTI